MKSSAKTVTEYLASLPADRQQAIKTLRAFVQKHVPKGYEEMLQYGAISWAVPLQVYPDTYNKEALSYVAIANQKNHIGLYLMGVYGCGKLQQDLAAGFKAAGKKLDMGKSCVRFKTLDDLALDAVAKAIAAVPMPEYIALAKAVRARPTEQKAADRKAAIARADQKRATTQKSVAKKSATKQSATQGSAKKKSAQKKAK